MYAHILSANALTIYVNGKTYTAHRDHPRFEDAVNALRANADYDTIIDLITPMKVVETIANTDGTIAITNGTVTYNGAILSGYAIEKLLELHANGFDATPLKNFIQRVLKNPSNRAVTDLYRFLEIGELPLMSDGRFIAYKNIREDWKDIHTGTIDNSIGKIVEMPRNQVNDDPNQTCSHGLHVCSQEYLAHFPGARCIAVAVDPADVVSIPVDYNTTKMRVSKYEVLEELPEPPNRKNYWDSPIYASQTDMFENENENDDSSFDIPENFTPWYGGDTAPVTNRVQYITRDGSTNENNAENLDWSHLDCISDIVAYRVIESQIPTAVPEPNVIG